MLVIGDLHLKIKEPFWSAQKEFLKWLESQFPDQKLLFLGDVFDSTSPHWDVFSYFDVFLKNRQQEVFILKGNHDFSRFRGATLSSLSNHSHVHIIKEIETFDIEGYSCLFIAYFSKDNFKQITPERSKYSFVFSHLTHPEEAFGDEGIDLSFINSNYFFYGHTHQENTHSIKHRIVGAPLPTRNGETLGNILKIDSDYEIYKIPVPDFLKIETIKYGEEIPNPNWLYNVVEAPSFDSVYDKYGSFYVRSEGIKLKETTYQQEIIEEKQYNNFLKNKFLDFSKKENLPRHITDCALTYMDQYLLNNE